MGEKLTKAQMAIWAATPERFRFDVNWRERDQQPAFLAFIERTLRSANEDDEVLSPASIDAYGTYVQMMICGWLKWPNGTDGRGAWTITTAGRAALSEGSTL